MKIKANESSNLYISPEELRIYSRYPQKRTKAISVIMGGSVALLLGMFFAPSIANSVGLSCNHERSQVEQEEQRRKSGGILGQLQGKLEDISGESKLDRLNSNTVCLTIKQPMERGQR